MAAARSYITLDDLAQGTLSITLFGTADAVGHVQGNAGYAVTWKLYGNPLAGRVLLARRSSTMALAGLSQDQAWQ